MVVMLGGLTAIHLSHIFHVFLDCHAMRALSSMTQNLLAKTASNFG